MQIFLLSFLFLLLVVEASAAPAPGTAQATFQLSPGQQSTALSGVVFNFKPRLCQVVKHYLRLR